MSSTGSPPSLQINMSNTGYGAAFIGLIIGAVLYGMVILQTNTYFHNYKADPLWLKLCVALLCLLDTLYLCFSVHMMYFYLINNFGVFTAATEIIWSLKGLGTVQVLVIWLVQCLYLLRIWKLSRKIVNNTKLSSALLAGIVIAGLIALGIGIAFTVAINELKAGLSLAAFRWAIYLAFSVTVVIDVFIAATMSFLLYRSQTGIKRTDNMLVTLIQYVVGTGILTSIASIVYVVLYTVRPNSFTYLAQEFSITRLYANSFLAMMNAREGLRTQMNEPVDLNIDLRTGLHFNPSTSSVGSRNSTCHLQTPQESPVNTLVDQEKALPHRPISDFTTEDNRLSPVPVRTSQTKNNRLSPAPVRASETENTRLSPVPVRTPKTRRTK